MSYRTDDEREFLISFLAWLNDLHWLSGVVDPEKQRWLVGEFLKEREEQREWGKS